MSCGIPDRVHPDIHPTTRYRLKMPPAQVHQQFIHHVEKMTAKKYSTALFVLLIVLVPVTVYGILSWYGAHYRKLPVMGEAGHRIGDFRMTSQHGEIITRSNWKNKIVVVNFFFTHCPVVCPRMTANLKMLQQLN